MLKALLFLIKYGIILFFPAVILLVLFALLGTIIHYFYSRQIYRLGDKFLSFGMARQPDEIWNLLSNEYRETTSLGEVVLLSETLHGFVEPDARIVWHRTHIKKRRGVAVIHGGIQGKGKVRFNLSITAKRAKNHKWYINHITLHRNYSRSIMRSD